MTTQIIEHLLDDIDGTSDADESIDFGLDGKRYEIDLTDEHAGQLREALAPYITAGRKAGGNAHKPSKPEPGGKHRMDPEQTAAIRQWVRDNGGKVNDRGRIPQRYVDAYQKGDTSIFEKVDEPELVAVGGVSDPFGTFTDPDNAPHF
jgi:hypothetical protein